MPDRWHKRSHHWLNNHNYSKWATQSHQIRKGKFKANNETRGKQDSSKWKKHSMNHIVLHLLLTTLAQPNWTYNIIRKIKVCWWSQMSYYYQRFTKDIMEIFREKLQFLGNSKVQQCLKALNLCLISVEQETGSLRAAKTTSGFSTVTLKVKCNWTTHAKSTTVVSWNNKHDSKSGCNNVSRKFKNFVVKLGEKSLDLYARHFVTQFDLDLDTSDLTPVN